MRQIVCLAKGVPFSRCSLWWSILTTFSTASSLYPSGSTRETEGKFQLMRTINCRSLDRIISRMHTLYRRVNKFINYEWCAWLPACLYHLSPIQPVGVAFCTARTLSVSARGRICVQLCWDRQVFARGAAAVTVAQRHRQ